MSTAQSPFDVGALMAAAVDQTGLDDFGPADFHEGLQAFCAALEGAQLNDIGMAAIPANIVGSLANRLRVVDWARSHPQVSDEQIVAPFVVVGIFRAGTTLMSYLLEKDERHRPLYGWEAQASVPPPDPASIADDPRIAATVAGRAMLEAVNPKIRVVQNEAADGPTECITVLAQDFKSLFWEALTNIPAYGTFLARTDHRSAYEYHRTVLQVLQSGGVRGRWSLKSPHHVLNLDALTAVYPDARIVVMHRDPLVVAASVCSLITTLTSTFSDADHRAYIADHWTDVLHRSVEALDTWMWVPLSCVPI
ncbi:MAG TPA: sulfotransferase, partial [Ilumatobacteraceae bacterium]|nr:sulfotransferase [Ilumatobacteraceae bacterium]